MLSGIAAENLEGGSGIASRTIAEICSPPAMWSAPANWTGWWSLSSNATDGAPVVGAHRHQPGADLLEVRVLDAAAREHSATPAI